MGDQKGLKEGSLTSLCKFTVCRHFTGRAKGTKGYHVCPVEILNFKDHLAGDSAKNRRMPSKGGNGKGSSNELLTALNQKSFFELESKRYKG